MSVAHIFLDVSDFLFVDGLPCLATCVTVSLYTAIEAEMNAPQINDESIHPVSETKQILRIGHTKFYQLVKNGEIETIMIGRRRFARGASIRKILHKGAS